MGTIGHTPERELTPEEVASLDMGPRNGGGITNGEYNFAWHESRLNGRTYEERFYRDGTGTRWFEPSRTIYSCSLCDEPGVVNGQLCPTHARERAHDHEGGTHAHLWSDDRDLKPHRHDSGWRFSFDEYAQQTQ